MNEISIAIPYHGDRLKWTTQTVYKCHGQSFVKEIVLTVEPSDFPIEKVRKAFRNYKKVKVYQNDKRLFVFRNKINAVQKCNCQHVALLDSDNTVGAAYFGRIIRKPYSKHVIYCPEYGYPKLNYQEFTGEDINLNAAVDYLGNKNFDMLINTMNYVFHRETWLNALSEAIGSDYEPLTADSAYMNYHCLKNGMVLRVVHGMTYRHTVHDQSTYRLYRKEGKQEYSKLIKLMKGEKDEISDSTKEVCTRGTYQISRVSDWSGAGGSSGTVVRKAADRNAAELLTD